MQHEGGEFGQKSDPLKTQTSQNTNQNSGKRDYVAQFPALGPRTTAKPPTVGTTVNKHNSGKRDYVAAQFPPLTSPTTPKLPTTVTLSTHNPQSPNGKRDYVAPQYPTLKPVQGNNQPSGKVKDLINYYDSQNNGQTTPQKVPSYSSILQGSTNKNTQGATSATPFTKTTPSPSIPPLPTKPMSFSDILSGSKSHSTPSTTSKPSTRVPANSPTTRPILPSSIVNKNQNTPAISSGPATDLELQTLSEELLRKDINNAAKFVTVNYQEKTTSHSKDDKAPGP